MTAPSCSPLSGVVARCRAGDDGFAFEGVVAHAQGFGVVNAVPASVRAREPPQTLPVRSPEHVADTLVLTEQVMISRPPTLMSPASVSFAQLVMAWQPDLPFGLKSELAAAHRSVVGEF